MLNIYASDVKPLRNDRCLSSLRQQGFLVPCEIPETCHLAVQIFLQNHGYIFHPEDLEKGQGDSC